jgi:hypothetical protein
MIPEIYALHRYHQELKELNTFCGNNRCA